MVHESLLSFVPGGRDNAVFVQKRAFETLASPAEDGSYYLHPSVIAACFRVNPGAIAAEPEREILNQEAQGDEDQVQALYKRMREAATWSAPTLVPETLVDQIQGITSSLAAVPGLIAQGSAFRGEASDNAEAVAETELSRVEPAEETKANDGMSRASESNDLELGAIYHSTGRHDVTVEHNPLRAMSATNAPTSPLTQNHSETQTQVEEDGDEKDDRLLEGANDPKKRNRTSSAPTWRPPGLGQQQQEGAWEEHLDEEGRAFYHNSHPSQYI